MSRKISRGARSAIAASALSASWAVRASWPSSLRIPATSSRMSSSSSTIRISDAIFNLFRLFLVHGFCLDSWQHDADQGSAAPMEGGWCVVQFEVPTVVLHDLLDDSEAKASALFPRRHVWLQQPLAV